MKAASGRYALFLDFDGTLVDIAERPDAVHVEAGLPAILATLRGELGGALALVTGRTIADVDRYFPDGPGDVLGLHGLERRTGGRTWRPDGLRDLQPEIDELRRVFADRPGILIEGKRVGVAVHWRLAPEAETAARDAVAALAERLGPAYRLQDGKSVRELVPAAAGKGAAIAAILDVPPYHGRIPVFAGDDHTDEAGFAAVNEQGGVSVKVGPGTTRATFRVESARAFRDWLAGWATTGAPDVAGLAAA